MPYRSVSYNIRLYFSVQRKVFITLYNIDSTNTKKIKNLAKMHFRLAEALVVLCFREIICMFRAIRTHVANEN